LLAGEGANKFAASVSVETADDEYFFTEHRYEQLLRAREEGVVQLDHTAEETELVGEAEKPAMGTVGAVACDKNGDLAAATSTGGMTNKKFGRVGDTPLIGSGTYADELCAVSCTGHGEYFMRGVTAYDVSARMRYKRITLDEAARETIQRLTEIKGEGGLIAVDAEGKLSLPFNSDGMYRGWISGDGTPHTEIYS
jgi:beta-aspartyl-peptidase (threonine type)